MSKSILLVFAILSVVGTICAAYTTDNCTRIDNCENCTDSNCHWIRCLNDIPTCQRPDVAELCVEVPCENTTTVPPTESPTTEVPTEPPTTEVPTEPPTTEVPTEPPTTEVPTEPPTTVVPTEPPTTEVPTEPPTTVVPTEPPTTEVPTESPTEVPTELPTTEVPTESPTTETPATTPLPPPTPSGRHFDAASFFGGMFLALAITAVAYAAWRFYKSRNGRSYHTL